MKRAAAVSPEPIGQLLTAAEYDAFPAKIGRRSDSP
jgi:hypothetical protein